MGDTTDIKPHLPADTAQSGVVEVWLRYDNFGTIAGLTRIDLAVRLTGQPERCLGETRPRGPAAQLYITFLPPF